jgi:hypothetical protein
VIVMSEPDIVRGPFSPDAARGGTRAVERNVLVVVHHAAAATRLMDLVPLVERDPRIQTVYTVPPASMFAPGAREFLRTGGALVMPWSQATQTRFDLALAAGQGLLEQLHAPVMVFPHGAVHGTYAGRWDGPGVPAPRIPSGLRSLTFRGRVIPAALMLANREHQRLLAGECPPATAVSVMAGDACLDRLTASLPGRAAYRDALGVTSGQTLVAVSSRWGTGSLLGRWPDLLSWAADQLPGDGYRIAAIFHPHIWGWHGRRQVHAWFAEAIARGVVLLPPEEGWRAALVAADLLIGDRGSVTCYGAALGVPPLLAPCDTRDVAPGSAFADLAATAPRLTLREPLAGQLDAAGRAWTAAAAAALRGRLSCAPGAAATITRREMYRLLRLHEPATPPVIRPVPPPRPLGPWPDA